MKKLRVAVVGAAGHHPYITKGIEEFEGAELCAVAQGCAEEDMAQIRRCYGAGPEIPGYGDFREMLDREEPDVLAVTPFFYLQAGVSLEALRRGIPVFSEKPLAHSLEDLAALREEQRKAGVPVGIMLDFRYAPGCATAHRIVQSGGIGVPTVGYCQKSYKFGTRADYYRRRETYGGTIPWIGIHAIDWFRWVTGCEYTAVSAQHVKLHRPDYPGMEDAATCLFELDNGGSVVMSFDFLRPKGAPTHGDDRLRLAGEKGVIEFRGQSSLEWITEEGVQEPPMEKPSPEIFADFLLSIFDPSHICRISTDDAFKATEVALKAREAADTGRRILLAA